MTRAMRTRGETMPDLLIRGLSPESVTRLKQQASRHGRSMQAEAKSIIEAGIRPTMGEWLERVDRSRAAIETERGTFETSSAGLVREQRDARTGTPPRGGR
ncbi:MAG: hypothetical protein K0B85_08125 [Coriobacteriia bacterium]|nr:hypothetical protein [Coriobacteriia bacterium]